MQLRFLYVPVADLGAAVGFYRDELGWTEAWREGEDTVAFAVPEGNAFHVFDQAGAAS